MRFSKLFNSFSLPISLATRHFLRFRRRSSFFLIGLVLVQVLLLVLTTTSVNFTREAFELFSPYDGKLVLIERGTLFIEGLPGSSYIDITTLDALQEDDRIQEAVGLNYERDESNIESQIYVGISPAKQDSTSPFLFATGIRLTTGRHPHFGEQEISIGKETHFAQKGLRVDDIAVLHDNYNATITGYFKTRHFFHSRFVLMPLEFLQQLTDIRDIVRMIVVAPTSKISLKTLEHQLENEYSHLNALNENEREEMIRDALDLVNSFTGLISIVSLAVGILFVISLTNLTLVERFREIGILRAIGISPTQVICSLIIENLISCSIAICCGTVLSFLTLSIWNAPSITGIGFTALLTVEAIIVSSILVLFMTTFGTYFGVRKVKQTTIIDLIGMHE